MIWFISSYGEKAICAVVFLLYPKTIACQCFLFKSLLPKSPKSTCLDQKHLIVKNIHNDMVY